MNTIYNKILIAVDGSELSISAAEQGIQLGKMQESQIILIHVIDDSFLINIAEGFGTPMPVPEDTTAMLLSMKDSGHALLNRLEKNVGRDCIKIVEQGSPKEEIIKAATELNANLVVLGTHGRTGLEHLIMGSVAEYVLRHSKCPVLVIPMLR